MHNQFRNPILDFDVPDPDVIPLSEGGYAMVASSFDRRPGLPLWRSDDLVSWRPAGFAGGHSPLLDRSGGVWAPAIREHGDRLYVTWADPDRGVFVTHARSLEGPWSPPRLLIAGPGPIDPCPFWDEDGRTWLIHGWARSRAGFANRLDIIEVDAELKQVIGDPRVVIDGDSIDGCTVLEGPKLYRRGDRYWIFAPAGGVGNGWQYAFRAFSLDGPWEERIILEQGSSAINGPHQGAWVVGAEGEEWFVHFQQTEHHGRILHLQPLAWSLEDWPLVGSGVSGGRPEPVFTWPSPSPRSEDSGARWAGQATASGWHGLDADPRTLVVAAAGRLVHLRAGGILAHPLPVGTRTLSVTLRGGAGALWLIGADAHRVEGSAALGQPSGSRTTTHTVLTVEIDGATAAFHIDGQQIGEPFTVASAPWTGLEVGISAMDEHDAWFEIPDFTTDTLAGEVIGDGGTTG